MVDRVHSRLLLVPLYTWMPLMGLDVQRTGYRSWMTMARCPLHGVFRNQRNSKAMPMSRQPLMNSSPRGVMLSTCLLGEESMCKGCPMGSWSSFSSSSMSFL
ncbi:hypothetical protein KP509_11G078300 [Ceratopteris richardii]|uniref:Secreted protein n=1 Tax=Ceratopteris richardii TaxID=49495 RepID=A0A8T2TWH3_CERRI|nr:hypothetical protein KP509_11G078300 [Ceratopteris richardii]